MTELRKHPDPVSHDEAKPVIEAVDLAAGYRRQAVIEDVACQFDPGELVGIVGPNGCGKSTLLKTLAGTLWPMAGQVRLNAQPLSLVPRRQRALWLAMLPQHPEAPPGMTVRDLVQCGRAPHARWYQPFGVTDRTAIAHAIRSCELDDLADRPLTELSGGERQRAWIAMTLAQQTQVVLLDEPTAALDIGHQLDVMHLLEWLVRQRRLTMVVVMHELSLAGRFCDRLLVMQAGRIVGQCGGGNDADWSMIEKVFGVTVDSTPADTPGPRLPFVRKRAAPASADRPASP